MEIKTPNVQPPPSFEGGKVSNVKPVENTKPINNEVGSSTGKTPSPINNESQQPSNGLTTKELSASINSAVTEANNSLKNFADNHLSFKVDDELDMVIVRVVDSETNEVVQELPPEEMLELARHLKKMEEENTTPGQKHFEVGMLLEEFA